MHPQPVTGRYKPVQPVRMTSRVLTDNINPFSCVSDNHFSGSAYKNESFHSRAHAWTWYLGNGNLDIEPDGIGVTPIGIWGEELQDKIFEGSGWGGVVSASWSLNPGACSSVGGCLEGEVLLPYEIGVPDRGSLKFFMGGESVYLGRIIGKPEVMSAYYDKVNLKYWWNRFHQSYYDTSRVDLYRYKLEGWKVFASEIFLWDRLFKDYKLSDIIKEIAEFLALRTPISFDEINVMEIDYTVDWQEFHGVSITDALNTLTRLAGDYVWGVDTNGAFFFSKIDLEPPYERNIWLGSSDGVELVDLQSNYSDIITRIIVEVPSLNPSTGKPLRIEVEDTAQMLKYGRTEQVIQYPFDLSQAEIADIQEITTSKTVTTINDNGNGKLRAIEGAAIDDFITLRLSKPVKSFVFNQPNVDHMASVANYEVYNEANELIWSGEDQRQYVAMKFEELTDYIKIVIKSLPDDDNGRWTWTPFDSSIGTLADAVRFAYRMLDLKSKPIRTAKLNEAPKKFISPVFGIRITDKNSATQVYEMQKMTYNVDKGLTSFSTIGSGQAELSKIVAIQEQNQKLADLSRQEADRKLKQEILKTRSTPYQKDLKDEPRPIENQLLWEFTINREIDLHADSITAKVKAERAAELKVLKNGNQVGSIWFQGQSYTGQLNFYAGRRFENGDVVRIVAPSERDISLEGFIFNLRGDWV